MGERAIIEKGMETLESIGQGESTTFVLPQELTSLVGRYGKTLTGSDVQDTEGLDSLDFEDDTREMLGLDDIDEIIGQLGDIEGMDGMEENGEDAIAEMDEVVGDGEEAIESADDVTGGDGTVDQPDEPLSEELETEVE
jgi:hypothetical protein